mmetsp:Transcript_29023/g.69091  ORF Transcript_29023/g.69091 Transcript_29023/m.69091 type:complete len:236 (+) Transcript_29023:360-1067(+)
MALAVTAAAAATAAVAPTAATATVAMAATVATAATAMAAVAATAATHMAAVAAVAMVLDPTATVALLAPAVALAALALVATVQAPGTLPQQTFRPISRLARARTSRPPTAPSGWRRRGRCPWDPCSHRAACSHRGLAPCRHRRGADLRQGDARHRPWTRPPISCRSIGRTRTWRRWVPWHRTWHRTCPQEQRCPTPCWRHRKTPWSSCGACSKPRACVWMISRVIWRTSRRCCPC